MRGSLCFYQQDLRQSKALFTVAMILLGACVKDPPPAPKLKVISAPSGPTGSISGQVIALGKLPSLKPQPLDASLHRQCGTSAPDLSLVVATNGALQFAVVSVDDAASSPLSSSFIPGVIDQKACVYLPPVIATRAGQSIKVKNSDPLMHNVRAMFDRKPVFNVAMPLENLTLDKRLPESPGVVQLHCDVHPWMTAWIATFPHDLYAVTDVEGRFLINQVAIGRRKVKLWHPRLGEKQIEVEVSPDGGSPLEIKWELSDPRPE